MNKKGFTIVELLCVITIIGIITVMAVPSIISVLNDGKKDLYCAKIKILESDATLYAKKLEKELNSSTTYYKGFKSLKIKVNDLVISGFTTPDKDNLVLDPRNDGALNDEEIIIYLENNKIKATLENSVC